ncbi:sacsin N-terminal ATP-binding-like domain-containing protein [Gordonia zhaorongruii]|uniref:sacsin N-terminal ATP-binding-like domain-containing protein n=1 Tax=Gordonia zhaorongruii TaxID=2597659 RepID=UPI00104F2E6D|nr:hypothetical protein [Gordonia zhaorongruii]
MVRRGADTFATDPADAADPFGTAALRDATLQSWRASPTRMAEDAAAERELSEIGYRGRLLTELAANAADAAAAASVSGRLAVSLDGTVLRFANTGAPLTRDGVESLTALRVSPKSHPDVAAATTVGRFGVGFRATAFADRVVVASTTGAIEFSRERTAEETGPGDVPAQRLAWPSSAVSPDGFATEVAVDAGDRATSLYTDFADQIPDLLLELPALERIDLGESTFTRRIDGDQIQIVCDGRTVQSWYAARTERTVWMVQAVDGAIVPVERDVLRSPTPTGVELTLPARVIADLPLTPDRRDVHPDADIAAAAAGYTQLVELVPDEQKHLLIPSPALTAGRVDGQLRAAIMGELAAARWVPTVVGDALAPDRAWVLPGLTEALGTVLGEVLEPLARPDVSHRPASAALVRLGARELGLADLADHLSGVQREPGWWRDLYAALADRVHTADDAAELGALPVPRTDGRTHRGARGVFVLDGLSAGSGDAVAPDWMPIVEPDAYDPLLDRLGLEHRSIADILADPALQAAVDNADDHRDLADTVLRLISLGDLDTVPAHLGRLELPATDGDDWPADELLLPDAPVRTVLIADSPFGTLDPAVIERYGSAAVRALGAGWGFGVVHDDVATGPDHDLPDEDEWWDAFDVPPDRVDAVRDLDLVDPDKWVDALVLLTEDPRTENLLSTGYTHWWLRRFAEIDGIALRNLRADRDSPDEMFAPVPAELAEPAVADAVAPLLVAAAPDDTDDAQFWLDALADPARRISAGVAARAHAALAVACRTGVVDVAAIAPPAGVRTLAGTVTDVPVVLDRPWWIAAVPADRAVLAGPVVEAVAAREIADLLDADVASEVCRAVVVGGGEPVDADSPEAVEFGVTTGRPLTGRVLFHDRLVVAVAIGDDGDSDDDTEREVRVPYWVDEAGSVHVERGARRDRAR